MKRNWNAQTSLAILVAITIVMVEVSVLISTLTLTHFLNKSDSVDSLHALTLIDSGVEEALLHLRKEPGYAGGTVTTPAGYASISVQDLGGDYRQITVVTDGAEVLRTFTGVVRLIPIVENPLKEYGIFGGDDIWVDGNNVLFRGDFRANDNLRVMGRAVVEGDAYMSGEGTSSNSRIRNYGILRDNLTTTDKVEGNLYSVDDIYVENSGYMSGDAVTKKKVFKAGGATIGGSIIQDPTLAVDAVPIPQFDFDKYKALAQAGGTYYTSPDQFLNFLSLNSNTITGGVYYIDSINALNFSAAQSYNITGTIISEGVINIGGTSYTHNADSALPIIVSKKSIQAQDNSCVCKKVLKGAIFALDDIRLNQSKYTGASGYGVDIKGVIWAGDNVGLENNVRFLFDPVVAEEIIGFDFIAIDGVASAYLVNMNSWGIN